MQELSIGQQLTGHVVKLMPFGAFAELGRTDWTGLVKIPEISWQPINHPEDVLAVGQEVTVEILAFGPGDQISLSLKRCQHPPQQP
jgi:small subunit ribosomal protein S1